MKTLKILSLTTMAGLALMGCPGDDGPIDDTGTESDTTNGTMTTPTTMTTVADSTSTTDGMTATESGSDSTSTGPGEGELPEFPKLDPTAYAAVDRMGFPAVNTGLILPGNKDAYNAATPVDDASLTFAPDILTSLETLHLGIPMMQTPDNTGLDDDLLAVGIQPCTPPPMGGANCDDQVAPFGIPDVLKITVGGGDAFPNGRRPADVVMDPILAVLLVDDGDTTGLLTFLDIDGMGSPLNPTENDVQFQDAFPYLAEPHM